MMDIDPEIPAFIDRIVRIGSAYDTEGMQALYTEDQAILFLTADGGVARSPKAQFIAEFAARRAAGEPPLSTEYRLLHVEQQGDFATALLYRRMSPVAEPALYELRLRRLPEGWRCTGETVQPWPDLARAGAFLPPRGRG
ncbi:hypothetical protein [Oceanicella sp. SM1341]|uniref:hypothetical protein n=1 Tax=Oceanicella sp. SM1341 TaxID=1548889 RepID=UPI000E542C7E|nr:hypothetical protein [Oceanicella sp. SM1341]